jgi:HptB-dependent secretion and biofilm anti anti-sigma factor
MPGFAIPREDDLALEITPIGSDAVELSVRGSLDIATIDRFRTGLERVLDRRPGSLVLDLKEVSFMDSIALAAIVHASRAVGGPDGLRIVVGRNSYARLILDATGLSRCFNVMTARDEA